MVKCSSRRALARSADGRGLVRRPTNREAGISFMPKFGDARDQGLLIVEVVKSDTRSDESSKQVSSYICKYPIKGGPVQHRKPVQRGKQARRGDTCRNSYMNCHIEYDKKHGISLPLLLINLGYTRM